MLKPDFVNDLDFKLLEEKYDEEELKDVLERIQNDYPVQYAIGDVEFLESRILVDSRVLIPRFETELLVDKLGSYIEKYSLETESILDLCTGSGCIGISLKKRFPQAKVTAVDISSDALELARENAKINSVEIEYVCKDIFKGFSSDKKFGVIVSNPPYVKLDEIVSSNTKYEPRIALYPGEDDSIFYREILRMSRDIVKEKSIIAFEIGASQGEKIRDFASNNFPNAKILVEKDYNQFDRFVFIFNNCE